jgi:hypothetical protein
MNEKLKDWTEEPDRNHERMKIDPLIIPCLVLLILMLTVITVQQHGIIGQYEEAVEILEGDRAAILDSYNSLWEDVSFARQTLAEIDLAYIQEIPSGVDLRVQLALDALAGGS